MFTNLLETSGNFGTHLLRNIYSQEIINVPSVSIRTLPSGVKLFGGGFFWLGVEDGYLNDQINPGLINNIEEIASTLVKERPAEKVGGEALLIARFGHGTWGHWLGELLPKIVAAEYFYPRRFRYVVSASVVMKTENRSIWTSISESLKAYGIGVERLVLVRNNIDYIFDCISIMDPIKNGHLFHPGALELMNRSLGISDISKNRKVALLRTESKTRNVVNSNEIADSLRRKKFSVLEPENLNFIEQVKMFRSATHIVGVLGSGLSGLIYSPLGVRVISLAPPRFGDRFFYAMIQDRRGRYADLRGEVIQQGIIPGKDDAFKLSSDLVDQALEILGEFK